MEITKEELSDVIKDAVKTATAEYAKEQAAAARLSKDEIMKVKDPIKRQQLIRENLDLF